MVTKRQFREMEGKIRGETGRRDNIMVAVAVGGDHSNAGGGVPKRMPSDRGHRHIVGINPGKSPTLVHTKDYWIWMLPGASQAPESVRQVQGPKNCKSVVTRENHEWRFFEQFWLDEPIPHFSSAYEFYQHQDKNPAVDPLGFYLLPPDEEGDLPVEWVPQTTEDLFESMEDDEVPMISEHVTIEKRNKDLARHLGQAVDFDGDERVPLTNRGFLDLEAEEDNRSSGGLSQDEDEGFEEDTEPTQLVATQFRDGSQEM
ncbi:hypothetical protein B0H11DRAFT_1898601 [Mycena galericulata]|nr:hypothetical protein B0H11DRAFT_1898601 [Mycena galericulata]